MGHTLAWDVARGHALAWDVEWVHALAWDVAWVHTLAGDVALGACHGKAACGCLSGHAAMAVWDATARLFSSR